MDGNKDFAMVSIELIQQLDVLTQPNQTEAEALNMEKVREIIAGILERHEQSQRYTPHHLSSTIIQKGGGVEIDYSKKPAERKGWLGSW